MGLILPPQHSALSPQGEGEEKLRWFGLIPRPLGRNLGPGLALGFKPLIIFLEM